MKVLHRLLPCTFMSVWTNPVTLTWDMEILPAGLNHLANICEFPVNVVSLTGGVNYYLPNTRSSIFNAKLYLTPAPLLMASEDIVKAMEQEPSVRQIRHMATLAQMSIVGIGGVDSQCNTSYQWNLESQRRAAALHAGSCGRYAVSLYR